MANFKQDKDHAANGRKVWARGDDTTQNPFMEIHAPYERVSASDSFLLYFVNPTERQFAPQSARAKWLKFRTYRAAVAYANSIRY